MKKNSNPKPRLKRCIKLKPYENGPSKTLLISFAQRILTELRRDYDGEGPSISMIYEIAHNYGLSTRREPEDI